MNSKIKQALESVGIKCFYIDRGTYAEDCVVYNYISKPSYYADNTLKGTEYTVLLNVYSKSGIEATKAKVIKAMNDNGIKGGIAQKTIKEDIFYNTAIQFAGFMRV